MTAFIADPALEKRLIDERRATGADKFDEVWEGVYVMSPLANNEHQHLAGRLFHILFSAVEEGGLGTVYPGANISDRESDWRGNFRCPDIAVFLNDNPAQDRESHWYGGPDLAIEICSPGDRTYEKLDFYAKVNTKEILVVDRDPWQLVLYRHGDDAMTEIGRSTMDDAVELVSKTVPLKFRLHSDNGLVIEVEHAETKQKWNLRGSA